LVSYHSSAHSTSDIDDSVIRCYLHFAQEESSRYSMLSYDKFNAFHHHLLRKDGSLIPNHINCLRDFMIDLLMFLMVSNIPV